jgi:heme oxygenase
MIVIMIRRKGPADLTNFVPLDENSAVDRPRIAGGATGLVAALRMRTSALHTEAERSGIIHEILAGRASRRGYALFLRNLLPAYLALESGLEARRGSPAIHDIARPEVFRAAAIEADLIRIQGPGWASELDVLPEGETYAARIRAATEDDGVLLVAHAYARYLGDLNGGQILKRLLTRALGLAPEALSFYEFPGIDDLDAFKHGYRVALDRSAGAIADIAPVLGEAAEAFRLNIDLSVAVRQAA